ncbi:recombinase family protein [Ferrovibrio sp.]|uniref:recombinase family protein n=1 Tax=Ferrovibrio sp. TaxID=1917215 RepID=UPI0035B30D8F
MTETVALYLRVSTTRQAEKDLSIPDQRRQAMAYCAPRNWAVVAEFVEPGASATDDRRPEFQKMIEAACVSNPPFKVILVHSFSRFFRDAFQLELHIRRLAKFGVRLVSHTQEMGSDPMGNMIRNIIALFDQHQSLENGKHTLRAMKENARQGFWNGSQPPLGYRVVDAEKRADKTKKRLEADPAEAKLVRQIFDLYLSGDGRTGPLGVKSIVNHLNKKGLRQRKGGLFSVKVVYETLTRTTYIGTHYFNQYDSRAQQPKPRSEWIEMATPSIIEPEVFAAVQQRLKDHNPKKTPPRLVNSPVLLSAVAVCATCQGGMTLRTGKSGQYRYYACSTCARKGKTACKGRAISMPLLDGLVMDQLCKVILAPDRVRKLLAELSARKTKGNESHMGSLKALEKDLKDTDRALERLYEAVEKGSVPEGDSLRNRFSKQEQRRDELIRQIADTKRQAARPSISLSPAKIEAFTQALHTALTAGNPSLRRAYLRLLVSKIEVDDGEIRMTGSNAVLAGLAAQSAKQIGGQIGEMQVPGFVREWRPRRDSNSRPAA